MAYDGHPAELDGTDVGYYPFMKELNWQVSVHGDRVVLRFPFVEEGKDVDYAFNASADDARELAEAITTAADECGPSEGSDPPRFERL